VAKLICIYWRDIPAQVLGRAGRTNSFKKELSPRFARAIDRAAMRAGRGSSDAYLEDWRRVAEDLDGDLEAAVNDRAAALEAEFSDDFLEAVVKAGGLVEEARIRAAGKGSAT
jgi:Virulence factor